METTTRRKDLSIESLRAIAIVLMVAGHVIGGTRNEGMLVPDDSAWRYFYVALEDVRMPLFTVLSGFVYAYRPARVGTLSPLLRGKARRLLVPLFTVGAAFFVVQMLVPGTNSSLTLADIWRVPVYGYGHFWFILALVTIFVTVGVLDALRVLDDLRGWSIALAVSVALYVAVSPAGLAVFSLNGALRLLPFFLLGYGLHRYGAFLQTAPMMTTAVSVFVLVYSARLAVLVADQDGGGVATRGLKIAVGLTAVTLTMTARARVESRALAWLGQFAFAVYLLHVFGSAGARIVLGRLGVDQAGVVFTVSLLVAIALPVLFEMTFGRVSWISWSVLGQRPWRPARRATPPVALPGRSEDETSRLAKG